MIWDMNAEELMVIANKRLCFQASAETRAIVMHMCAMVEAANPEFKGLLVPMCKYHGGKCHEMKPCGNQNTPQWKAVCKTTGLDCIWCQMSACDSRVMVNTNAASSKVNPNFIPPASAKREQ